MIHHTVKTAALGLFLKWWEEEREWGQEICEWGSLLNLVISLYSFRKTWLLPGSAWLKKKSHSASLREKGNMSPCLRRHTSSLVLTCISKLTSRSWKRTDLRHTHTERERRRGKIGLVSGLAPETSEPEALMSRQFLMLFFLFYFFIYTCCMFSF